MSDPPAFSGVADIFEAFLALHPRLKQEYFLNPRDDQNDAYESSQMNLLIANQHEIFGVYPMRSVTEFERFWAAGSGSDYALGAMHSIDDAAGDAAAIAEAGVRAAIEFDDGTGGPVESHIIRLVSAQAVDELELLKM